MSPLFMGVHKVNLKHDVDMAFVDHYGYNTVIQSQKVVEVRGYWQKVVNGLESKRILAKGSKWLGK